MKKRKQKIEEDEKGVENRAYLDLLARDLAAARIFDEGGISSFFHEKFSASAKVPSHASTREEFQNRAKGKRHSY